MKLTYKDKPHWIRFEYHRSFPKQITHCIIEQEGFKPISKGVSTCHLTDNFCKETGRKLALERALDNLSLDKQDRGIFWNAYLNRKNDVVNN